MHSHRKVKNDKSLVCGILFIMEYWKNKSLENLFEVVDGITVVEEWRDVVDFKGLYAVSSFGRLKTYQKRIWSGGQVGWYVRKEKILCQLVNRYGYLKVTLQVDKVRTDTQAHILVAKAFIPNPKNKPQVNHKKGNKKDNRYWELEWNTAKENSNHAIQIGIDSVVGEHNGRCILTEHQVLEIRSKYVKQKCTYKKLAKEYNVYITTIGKIIKRELWKHL